VDTERAEFEVLVLGLEEAGLHEVIWSFTTLWPESPLGMKQAVAKSTVKSLLESGHLELWKRSTRGEQSAWEAIPTAASIALLSLPATWNPDLAYAPETFYELGVTAAGEERLRVLSKKFSVC
jgi:hypothetical protein